MDYKIGAVIKRIFPLFYNLLKLAHIPHSDIKRAIRNSSRKVEAIVSIKNVEVLEGTRISQDSQIGEFTYIGKNCSITKATIGRYCSIADNVTIGAGEHYLDRVSTSSLFYDSPYDELTQRDCIIGNDVWIGVDSIIRRGVKIGNGAVIGANSFVNVNVPDFAIVVGSPSKILKYRFNQHEVSLINNSQWWAFSHDEARAKISELGLNS
jgi:virginiamycin A acetyltransferase